MTVLIIAIVVVLVLSALCSLTEAALYAVRVSHVRQLADSGSRSGQILSRFKANMERPIAAILILNTAANTAGATFAGAQAELVLGHSALIWFSIAFTLTVLIFSEIIPKILGVAYSQSVSRVVAVGLHVVTLALWPMLWIVQYVSRLVLPKGHIAVAPEDEVRHMARMSAEEGSILPIEAELIQNVLKLNDLSAVQIMTPSSVVSHLSEDMTLGEVDTHERSWAHSRLPVRSEKDPEKWVGVVLRRDILSALAGDQRGKKVGALCRPLHFVPSTTRAHILLKQFLVKRSHLFGVVDEGDAVIGLVTLEDVLESLLGEEIVDEVDIVVDMQQHARDRVERTLEDEQPRSVSDPEEPRAS